jgi:hypothetical protein
MAKSASRRRQSRQLVSPISYGSFNGPVRARWLSDGRYMALCNALEFTQSDRRLWTAPVGTRTDGASIPPIFWPFIGGPFEGKYRDASVVHDYECCTKTHAWRDVDRIATLLHRRPDMPLNEIESLTHATLGTKVTAIPRSIAGVADLSDKKRIKPVDRTGPCIEPGSC